MYFDHIHSSCFSSSEIRLFPTHPTLCLHLKNNLLSLISDAHVLLGVWPSIGMWSAYKVLDP